MTLLHLDNTVTLLTGPPASGKTSLLFNHAVQELVANRNKRVWMVCRSKIDTLPAHMELPEDKTLLRNLTFHYLKTREEFRTLIVSTLTKEAPSLLLVDSLQTYYTDLPDLYQTIKVLEHSLNHLHTCHGVVCQVVLSASTVSMAALNQSTLTRLFPTRYNITPGPSPGCFTVQDSEVQFYQDTETGMWRIRVLSV